MKFAVWWSFTVQKCWNTELDVNVVKQTEDVCEFLVDTLLNIGMSAEQINRPLNASRRRVMALNTSI